MFGPDVMKSFLIYISSAVSTGPCHSAAPSPIMSKTLVFSSTLNPEATFHGVSQSGFDSEPSLTVVNVHHIITEQDTEVKDLENRLL